MMLAKPPTFLVRRRPIKKVVSASVNWPEETGKFLGLFVLFTSSMNWWFYRTLTRGKKEDRK